MPYVTSRLVKGVRYYYIYENYREGQKIKHKLLKYLGNTNRLLQLSEGTLINLKDLKCPTVIKYGNIVFFYKLIQKLNLIEIIDATIQKTPEAGADIGHLVVILLINRLLAPSSKLGIQEWYAKTVLPKLLNISTDQIHPQALCRALDYLTDDVVEKIESQLLDHLISLYSLQLDTLFYDLTSTYFEGKHCALAFFGYSRDHRKDRRQIVIGLVIARTTRFPLKHWVFPGNMVDWETVEQVMKQLKQEKNLPPFTIVTDRGMFQKELRLQLALKGLSFITGVKSNEILAKNLLETVSDAELSPFQARSGAQFKYYLQVHEEAGVSFRALLILSPKMREIQIQALQEKIDKARTQLEELQEELRGRKKKAELLDKKMQAILKSCQTYFQTTVTQDAAGYWDLTFQVQEEELKKAHLKFGKYVLMTNVADLSPEEIIQAYLDKWEVEDAFKFLKNAIELRPLYHWKESRVKAHVFICILAYLLRTVIEHELAQAHLPFSYLQLKSILAQIKLIQLKTKNKVEEILTEIPPEAKKIFKTFNVELI